MNSKKAIEILQRKRQTESSGELGEEWDALNLSIEALKQILEDRQGNPLLDGELLPGETEEGSEAAQEIEPEATYP